MIRAENYIDHPLAAEMTGEKGREYVAEVMALGDLSLEFYQGMISKLLDKLDEGRRGWDNPDLYHDIRDALYKAYLEEKWIDVANYAAMLWNLESGTKEARGE